MTKDLVGAMENQPENSMKDNENVEGCSLLGCDNLCSGQEQFGDQLTELSSREELCSTKLFNCSRLFS
jgi:hypothetical protein